MKSGGRQGAPPPAVTSTASPIPGVYTSTMEYMFGSSIGSSAAQSIGSSIGSSAARSTGSSPNEKPWTSQEVTSAMVAYFSGLLENLQIKWDARKKKNQEKEEQLERKVIQVQQLATECGATDPTLWIGVLEILHSKCVTKLFMRSEPDQRLTMIKHYARAYSTCHCQAADGSQPCRIQKKIVPAEG